jgi:cytochrome c oxidase subunit 4
MAYRDSVMNAPDHSEDAHEHPSERTYIRIAIILAAVTLLEVVIYYIDAFGGILVPALIILSAIKFATVVGYFMHLKFDDRRLTGIFAGGLSIALAVFLALYVLQNFHKVVEFVSDKIAG